MFESILETYKKKIDGWELWSILSRTLIIAGSTIMYADMRFTTHFCVMLWSLLLHIRFLPYRNRDSNICAVLFCICDLLGAFAAYQSSEKNTSISILGNSSPMLQITFIVTILATLVIIGRYAFRAVRKQATVNRTALKYKDTTKMFASYTSLEKKLLFPILGVVWISVKLYQKYLGNKNKITPTENTETDENDEKDTDLTTV